MSKNTEKITLSYPKALARRADRFKGLLKPSAIYTAALEVEVSKLEAAAAAEKERQATARLIQYMRAAPIVVSAELQQNRQVTIPPDIEREISTWPDYEQSAFRSGWANTSGTITTWQRGEGTGYSGGAADPFSDPFAKR